MRFVSSVCKNIIHLYPKKLTLKNTGPKENVVRVRSAMPAMTF
jgi:hypothetical protein